MFRSAASTQVARGPVPGCTWAGLAVVILEHLESVFFSKLAQLSGGIQQFTIWSLQRLEKQFTRNIRLHLVACARGNLLLNFKKYGFIHQSTDQGTSHRSTDQGSSDGRTDNGNPFTNDGDNGFESADYFGAEGLHF